jgi:hydrogenase maturation protein HypF
MAEHGLPGPVLGVAYDGTGYGTDGALWGGELLLADYAGFTRLATFRPLPLAGGEAALREVWRLALALLDDAFDGAPPLERLPLFRAVPEVGVGVVRRMIGARLNAPPAHGVGRYFDAFGALALGRPSAAYEGQLALLLNLAAGRAAGPAYPFAVDTSREPWLVDLRPAVRAAVEELLAGMPAARLAAAFHDAIVEATARVLRRAVGLHGRLPVVLSGGCFQNPRLAEGVAGALAGEASVFLHREVPPGDGGIALGQALVADAMARKA